MNSDRRNYAFDDLYSRLWQIVPAAWVVAKSLEPELRTADLEDILVLPADPEGATIVMRIRTAHYGEVIVRGNASANGDLALLQPENMESFGNIFDQEVQSRLASIIASAAVKR
jgi:hypothetical protein